MIGKKIVESRPATLTEVSDIMEKRLEDAKAEMKRRKKKPLPAPAAPVVPGPEPVVGAEGEAAAPAAPAPVGEEEKSPLGMEQRFTLEYAQKFAKLGKRKAAEMQEKLMGVNKMTPEAAVKIVDLLPVNADQLKLVFAKEKITADSEMLADVHKIVDDFKK